MTTYQARVIHQAAQAALETAKADSSESPARVHDLAEAALVARDQYLRLRRAEEAAYIAAHPEVLRTGTLARELPADVDRGFSLPE